MNAIANQPRSEQRAEAGDLAGALSPGLLVLKAGGGITSADGRAMELLGCPDRADLERAWSELRPRLEAQGLWSGGERHAVLDLPGDWAARRRFDLRGDGGVLLIQDAGAVEALESDLRLSALMRSLAYVTPAVAHDLRAPINAMVFNIEILKETIAAGKGAEPGGRERQLRYVNVLKEELNRLHKEMEIFIAHISPRGDRTEILDLRELVEELGVLLTGPARKQQVQVRLQLPEAPVPVEVNRYLLRQALLHMSLAALADVPKEGALDLRLERRGDRAWMSVAGTPAGTSPGMAAGPAGFDIRLSPSGALAQLHVARGIVASQGGEVRPGEAPQTFEIELTVAGNKG
ncbi:MAG: histidine kinase dimerization/phospho-acceptor domain-containing protein [Thermoanaerobaculia bacterium]